MSQPLSPDERGPGIRLRAWRLAAVLLLVLAAALVAQEDPPPDDEVFEDGPATEETAPPAPMPRGEAALSVPGRPLSSVPFTLTVDGPRFALRPLAEALGATVSVGPRGESHMLTVGDERFVLGPGQSLVVATKGEGGQEMIRLSGAPMMDSGGLMVPLDLLSRAFGEKLNYDFLWSPQELRLDVVRRQRRELDVSINVVHQFGFSTVEMIFSEPPRYRVERRPGALVILFTGDRLRLPLGRPRAVDPLVSDVQVLPDRVRIELAPDANAAEPRLLTDPVVSLIVEVYRQAEPPQTAEEEPTEPRKRRPNVYTIVLDPGHGGEESGAIGVNGTAEEDLTLRVARALERALERRLPVRVVLTRDADVDVPLDARTALANQNKGDLFISLHFNSAFGARAHGAETYFLSREASDQLAASLAAQENRSGSRRDDPDAALQLILWDLAQSHHLAESQRFANLVQEELNQALGLRDRGVKQAPFRVLMGAAMPAVLVELGFLSNPEEEAKLQSAAYVDELVGALVRAVARFKSQNEAQEGERATPAPDESSTADERAP